MSKQAKRLGPCVWNGNEIVQVEEPNKAVAGLAPDAPEEWGPLFAAAPEMYEALERCKKIIDDLECECDSYHGFQYSIHKDRELVRGVLAKVRGGGAS